MDCEGDELDPYHVDSDDEGDLSEGEDEENDDDDNDNDDMNANNATKPAKLAILNGLVPLSNLSEDSEINGDVQFLDRLQAIFFRNFVLFNFSLVK